MNGRSILEGFVIGFLVVSIGFYGLEYSVSDAVAGGLVGGCGISLGIALRTHRY